MPRHAPRLASWATQRDSWLWCERLADLIVDGALLAGLVVAVEELTVLLFSTQCRWVGGAEAAVLRSSPRRFGPGPGRWAIVKGVRPGPLLPTP